MPSTPDPHESLDSPDSPDSPEPLVHGKADEGFRLDLGDFDAVGIATELLIVLRAHAIEHTTDAAATIAAPPGWHRLVATARHSGHLVLSVRYGELSASRWNNVAGALATRGWQLDEDGEGSTRRYPPGTEASTAAFELLAVLTVSGAPSAVRLVTAVDGEGRTIDLPTP